jgi:SpoVK/Ycf46/Vps4 family AAA+-type ATPase
MNSLTRTTTLSKSGDGLPSSVSKEKLVAGLAGLAITPELDSLASVVVHQWTKRERFKKLTEFGIQPIQKVLLYGPPGNGKTTACHWLASKINVPMYLVRSDALIGSYLGTTANNIRETTDWLAAKAGPSVVLFDEVESLFPSREESGHGTFGREIASAMTTFWQILDRWTGPQLFCFATNMPGALDEALISRFELRLEFGPPSQSQIESVVEYWAEVFHEYSPEQWKTEVAGGNYESFRQLWQTISNRVREIALQ